MVDKRRVSWCFLNRWNVKACGSQIDPNDMKVATYFPGGWVAPGGEIKDLVTPQGPMG